MRRICAIAAGALAIALGSGCGGGDSSVNEPPVHLGGVSLGVELRLADCSDWESGTAAERLGTIAEIANFVGGPVGTAGGHGATLDTQQAYDVMEEYCS